MQKEQTPRGLFTPSKQPVFRETIDNKANKNESCNESIQCKSRIYNNIVGLFDGYVSTLCSNKFAQFLKIFIHRFIPSLSISLAMLFAVQYLVDHSTEFSGDYGQAFFNRFGSYYLAIFMASSCIVVSASALKINVTKLYSIIGSGRYKLCAFSLLFAPFTNWTSIAGSPSQDVTITLIYLFISMTFIVCALKDSFYAAEFAEQFVDFFGLAETENDSKSLKQGNA